MILFIKTVNGCRLTGLFIVNKQQNCKTTIVKAQAKSNADKHAKARAGGKQS